MTRHDYPIKSSYTKRPAWAGGQKAGGDLRHALHNTLKEYDRRAAAADQEGRYSYLRPPIEGVIRLGEQIGYSQ